SAYSIRAYVDRLGQTEIWSPRFVSYYIAELSLVSIGVIFILLILAKLYQSILPKLRYVTGRSRGNFEATLVDHTRLFLLPVIILVIIGGVYTSPDYSEHFHTGEIMSRVAAVLLFGVSLVFLFAAWLFGLRYPENKRPFKICFAVTALFVVSMVYKIVCTFKPELQGTTWAFFVFSPLLEILALGTLTVDLQKHFLGRSEDKLPEEEV
ncbi:hypothetical protein BGZ76_011306, partial [Entomortierella beljakovae]